MSDLFELPVRSDIASLHAQLSSPRPYQEIRQAQAAREAARRWPLLAEVRRAEGRGDKEPGR